MRKPTLLRETRWSLSRHLVTVFYRDTPRFRLLPDLRDPPLTLFRVLARDRAGNVGEDKTNEAGGLQGTAQNLGASLGTALIGAVLISALSTGFVSRVEENPAVPESARGARTMYPVSISIAASIVFASPGWSPNTASTSSKA